MADVSDIVRVRDMSFRKPGSEGVGIASAVSIAGADLFTKPCNVGISEALLDMFSYTMKKRKFPFVSEDDNVDAEAEKLDDVEQTRRMSANSVRSSLYAMDVEGVCEAPTDLSWVLLCVVCVYICRRWRTGEIASCQDTARNWTTRCSKTSRSSSRRTTTRCEYSAHSRCVARVLWICQPCLTQCGHESAQ